MSMATIIASLFKETIDEYITIETATENTLIFRDGQLASIFEIHGVNTILGYDDMNSMIDGIGESLRSYMSHGCHQIQFAFVFDPEAAASMLDRTLRPARKVCKAIGVDDSILIDDQIKKMAPVVAEEAVYAVLYTDFRGLTRAEVAEHKKKLKAKASMVMPNSQNLFVESSAIAEQHNSFVSAILSDFNNAGIRTSLFDAREAAREIRRTIEPDLVSNDWLPYMPGDKVPLRLFNNASAIGIPRISEQVMSRAAELEGSDVIIGSTRFRPMLMALPPKNPKMFSELFSRVPGNIPWRMSIHINGDVMSGSGVKVFLSTLLKMFDDTNRRIEKGYRYLDEVVKSNMDTVVGLRMGFMTWAPVDNTRLIETRFALLMRSIEGWGECRMTADMSDPFESFIAMSPGLSLDNLKSSMPAAPINDILPLFPVFRPSVPWDYGFMSFTSLDDKLLPMEMASSVQANWNTLLFAPPGFGKSVLLLNMVLGLIFKGGNTQLPKIGIIDIGPSSKGLINFLKHVLPEHLKPLVGRYRMQFTEEYSINILDTMTGKREPLPLDREYLVNIISILATPGDRGTPYTNSVEIIGAAIDVAYKEKASKDANHYEVGELPDIDKLLEDYRMDIDSETTWWEVVDYLAEKGRMHEASLAQRMAVPLLADIAKIIKQDPGIRDLYCEDTIPGESVGILDALARNIQASIREFGIFSKPTIFSLDDMRVVSLDLDEVAKGGAKKAAVMYMVARYALGRTFYFDEDYISLFPEQYREHYKRFFIENKGMSKGMFMDEFHRTKPISGNNVASGIVRAQAKMDMREGRKFGVQLVLASQEFSDYDDEMIDLATTRMIIGYGSKKEAKEICNHLGLPPVALSVLLRHVNGPDPKKGSSFLMNYKTKQGEYTQALTFKVSSIRLWCISTTVEDDIVIRTLMEKFSYGEAITFLAEKFPGGTCKSAVENMAVGEGDDDAVVDDTELSLASEKLGATLLRELSERKDA